jgi:hypothetical protein
LFFRECETAAPGSEHDAEISSLIQRELIDRDRRICHSFSRGGQSKRYGARDMLAVFGIELGLPIEVFDLAGDLDVETSGVEACDPSHAAPAGPQGTPVIVTTDTDRRHATKTGDDHTARTCKTAQHSLSRRDDGRGCLCSHAHGSFQKRGSKSRMSPALRSGPTDSSNISYVGSVIEPTIVYGGITALC